MPLLRSTFIGLSQNQRLRSYAESSQFGKKLSGRFVAGMKIDDALCATESLNRADMHVTLDSLGENVFSEEHAVRTANIYHSLLEAVASRGLQANVSLKLTQMGMDIDPELAERVVRDLTEHARRLNSFVRVDMEGSPYTEETIQMVRRVHRDYPGFIGVVIQAYLYRSEKDITTLISEKVRIRLCKGAYQETADVAFPDKKDVDDNYLRLASKLLDSGTFHGIATHDPAIIDATKKMAQEQGISKRSFEFQMLYGVRRDLQESLVNEGYGMRVYVPFGTEWYPYFMRRLAERPANVLFVARNLLRP